jgi:hypothetical protein
MILLPDGGDQRRFVDRRGATGRDDEPAEEEKYECE